MKTPIDKFIGAMRLPKVFTGDGECFVTTVAGDGLTSAGINHGDYIIIDIVNKIIEEHKNVRN